MVLLSKPQQERGCLRYKDTKRKDIKMNNSIFEAARDYEFDVIKAYLEGGGELNICDDKGVSLFARFVEGYLMKVYEEEVKEKAELYHAHNECDYDFWDSHVYDFQVTPLEERKYKIKEELEYLIEKGADLNLCKIVDGMTDTPLSYAVCEYQDYYLTKFLLEHGANPGVWLFDESERAIRPMNQEHFLIEHMDVLLMERRGEAAETCLAIAQLLWKYGLQDWLGGFCIDIDPEKGVVGGHPLQVRF